MPQIIVTANGQPESNDRAVMLTERVTAQDFESRHFQTQLVERLSWAVGDAQGLEERAAVAEPELDLAERNSGSEPSRPDRQRRSASVLTTAS
ncbi:MAG: hypothetical protein ACRDNK_22385 [Solirubrobacteraceae bacterium]